MRINNGVDEIMPFKYQEPYQDENDEIKEMDKPFETDHLKESLCNTHGTT